MNEYKGSEGSTVKFTGMIINDLKQWSSKQVNNTINYSKVKT